MPNLIIRAYNRTCKGCLVCLFSGIPSFIVRAYDRTCKNWSVGLLSAIPSLTMRAYNWTCKGWLVGWLVLLHANPYFEDIQSNFYELPACFSGMPTLITGTYNRTCKSCLVGWLVGWLVCPSLWQNKPKIWFLTESNSPSVHEKEKYSNGDSLPSWNVVIRNPNLYGFGLLELAENT